MRLSAVEPGVNWVWLSLSLVPSQASSCAWCPGWIVVEYSSEEQESSESGRALSGSSSITSGRRCASNRGLSDLSDLGEMSLLLLLYAPSVAAAMLGLLVCMLGILSHRRQATLSRSKI